MADENNNSEGDGGQKMLLETARKFFLAGLGAAMLAQDEMVDLANKLVERGEATQEKRRKMVDDFVSERRKQSKEAVKRAEKDFGKQMEQVLHRLNMPTRSEVKALNRKITRLTKKVDQLNKASA